METEGERKPVAQGWEWDRKGMGNVNVGDVVEKVAEERDWSRSWREWRCCQRQSVLGEGCGGSGTGGPLAISVAGGGLAEGNALVSASSAL